MSLLKEVSRKSFVLEFQTLMIFEGSLAEAAFLSFKASFLKEVSQKSFVFELQSSILNEVSQNSFVFDLQSFIFEGSLPEKLCFGALKFHF